MEAIFDPAILMMETCLGYFIIIALVDDNIFCLSIIEFQIWKITWKSSKMTSSF